MDLSKIKNEEIMLKVAKKKEMVTYKGIPISLPVDYSVETLGQEKCNDTFKVLKEKSCQPQIFHPAKLLFLYKGEIKIFPDKKKKKMLREVITTRPALQEMLKGVLQAEMK